MYEVARNALAQRKMKMDTTVFLQTTPIPPEMPQISPSQPEISPGYQPTPEMPPSNPDPETPPGPAGPEISPPDMPPETEPTVPEHF
jgi:hypothetical protein